MSISKAQLSDKGFCAQIVWEYTENPEKPTMGVLMEKYKTTQSTITELLRAALPPQRIQAEKMKIV